jgi:hypothetical protein
LNDNLSSQTWIQFAIKHLGIVVRERYLATLGWELVQLDGGTHKIERTANRPVPSYLQPMNGFGLLMNCLNDGLPVANPLPIIAKLSGLTNDVICINTQLGAAAKPANSMDGFRQFAKTHPQLAMSALFQVPATHPLVTQGVTVHGINQMNALPETEPLFMVQNDDPELDAMLDKIFRGEGDESIGNLANLGNQYFTMGMGNGTQGEKSIAPRGKRTLMLTKSQVSIETSIPQPLLIQPETSHPESTTSHSDTNTFFARSRQQMAGSADCHDRPPHKSQLNSAVPCEHHAFPVKVACGGGGMLQKSHAAQPPLDLESPIVTVSHTSSSLIKRFTRPDWPIGVLRR